MLMRIHCRLAGWLAGGLLGICRVLELFFKLINAIEFNVGSPDGGSDQFKIRRI